MPTGLVASSPPMSHGDTAPYLLRCVAATVHTADILVRALAANESQPSTVDTIRDTALSVATLDRLLCQFISKCDAGISPMMPLPQILQRLQMATSGSSHTMLGTGAAAAAAGAETAPGTESMVGSALTLPAGGNVSIMYHFIATLEGIEAAARRLARSRWDRTSTYVYPALALTLFLTLRYTRVASWKLRRWSSFFLGIALTRLYTSINDRISAVARLQALNAQLVILLRMWLIATDLYEGANAQRQESYKVLVSALADSDYFEEAKPLARRLLERTSLPNGACIWPSKDMAASALKHGLDVVYAGLAPVFYATKRYSSAWGKVVVGLPLAAVTTTYYAIRRKAAAETTSALLTKPDIEFIKFVWRLSNTKLARVLFSVAVPRLAFDKELRLGSISAHFMCNASVQADRLHASCAQQVSMPPASGWQPSTSFSAAERRAAAVHYASQAAALSPQPSRPPVDAGADLLESPSAQLPHTHALPRAALFGSLRDDALLPPTLLYIHGGGFVGSFWAQDRIMLSKWAANSREPLNIVFPHYTLAPEARFPDALNELLYTYLWLQRRCAAIAVAGESAGGNLATALLLRLIAIEAPRPRGLVLAYPALNLNPSPSPSRSLHMNDALVPISLLLRLAQAYMPPAPEDAADDNSSRSGRHIDESAPVTESGGCASLPIANVAATSTEDVLEVADAAEDDLPSAAPPNPLVGQFHITDNFFVHPLYAPDALLQHFPTTHIIVGGLDPLLDDAVDFNTRLRRLSVPGDLQVHRTLPHGFLNFQFLTHAQRAVAMVEEYVLRVLA